MPQDVIDKEKEKRHILEEIDRVRGALDEEHATPSLQHTARLNELILKLVRLYKRYTDLANSP